MTRWPALLAAMATAAGYRGCLPGPVFCARMRVHGVTELGGVAAVAGVEFADGRQAAFNVHNLDPGGRPSVFPMPDDGIDHSLRPTFPSR